jgi:16S rRNA G966 N2-methylase RsmD
VDIGGSFGSLKSATLIKFDVPADELLMKPSSLLDTRIIYCGDCLDQIRKLPEGSIDLIYIDPPFNSNRNYEVFWGETKEKRAFEDRHASTAAYIDFMRPRCVELARVLKKTGSFYCKRQTNPSVPAMNLMMK